jgi:HlyD family secretion protein
MTGRANRSVEWILRVCAAGVAVCCLAGCDAKPGKRSQGYIEGDFVYIASPVAGALESLKVRKGDQVKTGQALFALESVAEKAARDEAEGHQAEARANLEDLRKGKRPLEIDSLKAQLAQAKSAAALAVSDLTRQERLFTDRAISAEDLDRARSTRDQDQHRVAQLEADLGTAELGGRADQIAAAEAEIRARGSALAQADWSLGQKHQNAPSDGAVFDTLYREGEWVPAGRPVVIVLPPPNIKARAFVAEPAVGALRVGQKARVLVDGAGACLGKISFISPQAEYTPPVIYSRESRDKLLFMVEIVFEPGIAATLRPGQPVDVEFGN